MYSKNSLTNVLYQPMELTTQVNLWRGKALSVHIYLTIGVIFPRSRLIREIPRSSIGRHSPNPPSPVRFSPSKTSILTMAKTLGFVFMYGATIPCRRHYMILSYDTHTSMLEPTPRHLGKQRILLRWAILWGMPLDMITLMDGLCW